MAELGLSVQAARNLYTGKVNPEVVSRLLENPQFANATFAIEQYCNGDLTTAFAAQNRLYTTLANALIGTVPTTAAEQTAAAVSHLRQPAYQQIQQPFKTILWVLSGKSKKNMKRILLLCRK